jgi:hypothetical protein
MFAKLFSKKNTHMSSIANFTRNTSSAEKKRVFMAVLKKATEDQVKTLQAATNR